MSGWQERRWGHVRGHGLGTPKSNKGGKGGGSSSGGAQRRGRGRGGKSAGLVPVGGFAARKLLATGSSGGSIIAYDAADHNINSDFNLTTGEWTPTNGGLYWVGPMGFPAGGLAGGSEWSVRFKKDTVNILEATGRNTQNNTAHGSSVFAPGIHEIVAGADYILQQNGDTSEDTIFSAAPFASRSAFRATKTTSTGSAGDVITGYDAVAPNIGNDFNITTGVYTVPATDLYLITFHGFPFQGANGFFGPLLVVDGSDEGIETRHKASSGEAGNSNGFSVLKKLIAGDTVSVKQIGDKFESIAFSILRLEDAVVSFSARKGTASGSEPDDIAGWTEDWDDGSNFNATTGLFTAPESKRYLIMWYGHNDTLITAENHIRLRINSVTNNNWRSREFILTITLIASHGGGVVLDLTANDTLALQQSNDLMEDSYFAVVEVA